MSEAEFAPAVLKAGQDMQITAKGITIAFATVYVESGWTMYANEAVPDSMKIPHEAVGSDSKSVGLFQQQVVGPPWWWGSAQDCMDPYKSAQLFFVRLRAEKLNISDDGKTWDDYTTDATSPGGWAQLVQQSAYPDRYDQRMSDAVNLYHQLTSGGTPVAAAPVPTVDPRLAALQAHRPDFNEYENFSDNSQDRGGTDVDLWLNHTEEGDMNADALVNWMKANGVSYHYAGSQAADGGVTVVDMVDTDLASWSVMNSNNRSINACYAGSYTNWSRQEWLDKAGKVIDVFAYLAVQDCIKYPKLAAKVIAAPYSDPPGIADHNYCSVYLQDGNNHTDVGPNFPWDVQKTAVAKYWAFANSTTQQDPHPNPTPPAPAYDPTQNAQQEILIQTRGRFAMLGNQTMIETLAELRDHLTGSKDAGKQGFEW